MADEDIDIFIPNTDDEWKTPDDNSEKDGLGVLTPGFDDEKAPDLSKKLSGAKTIFVTYQFRFFHDDYEVIGPIGLPGQFGIAYECYQKSDPLETRRCVKEINKARFHHIDTDARSEVLATMQNEIAILKKVDHPNIVKLFDVYEDRHRLHLVMEFLPGGELFARICEKESFSEKEAVRILREILEALDHMHDKNILHLDLKPDNILFSSKADDAPIKLIDFGMARVVPRLAKLKDRVGTPNYMAPEVFEGHYSKAADIWSVGVIAFCMLFGFPPFYLDEEDITLDEHGALELKIKQGFLAEVRDGFGPWFPAEIGVSEDCRYLLGKMLEMDVKKRWTVKECLSCVWVRGFENASEKTIPPIVRDALRKFHSTSKFKVAISNLFRDKIDSDHIKELRVFFDTLDANKDGSISLLEFKDGMMNTFHTDLSDEQLEQIFSNVDIDDDRSITFEELMTITAHRMLIDEDERLFQAFTDLDEDGDGLISKDELRNAMRKLEDENESDDEKKGHKRDSTIMLKRFQSAFVSADKNGDGHVDYEEFLRILHPDFDDETMTMMDFKSNVTNGEGHRVRGAQFNVDYQTAQAAEYVEVKPSPRRPATKPDKEKMKILTLDAFNNKKSRSQIEELKEENSELTHKLQQMRIQKEKYEKEMLVKLEQQTNQLQQFFEKDVLIANLNQLLDARNSKIDKLQHELDAKNAHNLELEQMLQHAIESKIKSLVQTQDQIQKLKSMLQTTQQLQSSSSPAALPPPLQQQKARHLNHLIVD
eukprot:17159_1